jgi:hypothetical protein
MTHFPRWSGTLRVARVIVCVMLPTPLGRVGDTEPEITLVPVEVKGNINV